MQTSLEYQETFAAWRTCEQRHFEFLEVDVNVELVCFGSDAFNEF